MRQLKMVAVWAMAALMAACGGGGGNPGSNSGGSNGGGTTAKPSLSLQITNSAGTVTQTVTDQDVFTLRATVRDAGGNIASGQVVTFRDPSGLLKFTPAAGTALSDSNGVAIVQVRPATSTSAGAGTLTADVTIDGVAATQATLNFQVVTLTGSGDATIKLGLRDVSNSSTNVVSRSGVTYGRATVLDGAGRPVVGVIVTFSAESSLVKLSPSSGKVLTNESGVASVELSAASAASAGAGTLSATATVGTASVASSMAFQVPAGVGAGIPSIQIQLRDAAGVSTNTVALTGVTKARATVLDAGGAPVAGRLVNFTGSGSLVTFNPASGAVLTDAAGVASIDLTRASLSATGAGTLSATATVGTTQVSTTFDYQLAAATLALQGLDLGAGVLPAYGSRPISVTATLNGSPSTSLPVQVSFTASCGSVTPSVVTTDATGRASSTYKADTTTCSGSNVTITASAVGASSVNGTIQVQAAQATNIKFDKADPTLIYLQNSIGPTQSRVSFKVVDSTGNAIANQSLQLTLINAASGVSIGTVGNTAAVTLTSDGTGLVSVPVFSGTVPTSLQVRATLSSNSAVRADSNVLTVASGIPVQRAISVSLSKFSIEGMTLDGQTSKITASLADRVGNPVPDGTPVNFVSSSGVMIPPTCYVQGGTSSCSVDIRSQGTRIPNGHVAILAYTPGEEDFVDLNGNNVYDPGEPYTDLGNALMDANFSGSFDNGEFTVPRSGALPCSASEIGRPGTCDGIWGAIDVRAQARVIFASSTPEFVDPAVSLTSNGSGSTTVASFSVTIQDLNGNSMPTGTQISVTAISGPGRSGCTVQSSQPATIPNTYGPLRVTVSLSSGCAPGTGDRVSVTTTSPSGLVSSPYIYSF